MDVITFPDYLNTTSGLSILMHGVISLPDATSYDKVILYTSCPIEHMLLSQKPYVILVNEEFSIKWPQKSYKENDIFSMKKIVGSTFKLSAKLFFSLDNYQ